MSEVALVAGDITRRFRASTGIPYVNALTAVMEYARDHIEADFVVGHIGGNVSVFIHNGLTVSGPEPVVEALTDLIEHEGLHQVEA